jgi:prespore-specific regulator
MKGRRWTEEEDQLLREFALTAIESGKTQIEAFEEVGRKLNRTPGACGFRWNAVLRQQDLKAYADAKKKRVYRQLQKKKGDQLESLTQVIPLIKELDREGSRAKDEVKRLTKRLADAEKALRELESENSKLKEERQSYDLYENEVKDKYQDLLRMLQSVRKQAEMPEHVIKNEKEQQVNADSGIGESS